MATLKSPREMLQILLMILIIAILPTIAYNVGAKTTTYNIAKQCATNNTFTEHGNDFRCYDIDDYRGN